MLAITITSSNKPTTTAAITPIIFNLVIGGNDFQAKPNRAFFCSFSLDRYPYLLTTLMYYKPPPEPNESNSS